MDDVRSLIEEAIGDVRADPEGFERSMRRVRTRQRRRRIGAGTTALVLAVAATWLVWWSFGTTSRPTPASSIGQRIAFTTQRPSDLTSAIAVMAPDGSHVQLLGEGQEPEWSPDGQQIAFSQRTGDGPVSTGIFVMRADGTDVRRLTTNPSGDDEKPAWTPDGTTLVFSRSTFVSLTPDPVASRSHRDLYTVAADGTGLTKLIGGPTDDFAPEWLPDGSRVAFLRIVDPASDGSEGIPQIWIASSDGSEPTQVTRLEQGPFWFDWSPDGSAFALGAGCAITIVNDEGQVQSNVALRRDIGCAFDPVWSPDGARLAFVAGTDNDHDIYETDLDGTEVTRLTGPPGSDFSPSWWGGSAAMTMTPPTEVATEVRSTVLGVTVRYPSSWKLVDLWPLARSIASWSEPLGTGIGTPADTPEHGGLPLLQLSNVDLGLQSMCGRPLPDGAAALYVAVNGGPYLLAPDGTPRWSAELSESDGPCGPGWYAYRKSTMRIEGNVNDRPYLVFAGSGAEVSDADLERVFAAYASLQFEPANILVPPQESSPTYVVP
jgi:TolB protein